MISDDQYVIRATALIGLIEALDGDRALANDLLIASGVAPSMLDAQDSVLPLRRLMNLCTRAAQAQNNPSFGLKWCLAMQDHFLHCGPLLLSGFASETMGQFVLRGIKYWELHTNGFSLELVLPEGFHQGMLRIKTPNQPYPPRQWLEHTMGNICLMGRLVSGSDEVNASVARFQHNRPEDISLHQEIFRCPLEFGAEHNELVYDPSFLMRPTHGGMKKFHATLAKHVRHRLDRLEFYDQSVEVLLTQTILSLTGTGLVSAALVAESLGMSVKTMHRKLLDEGTSFSKVLENCRLNIAEGLLATTQTSVGAIAGLLDYSGHAQFTAAFKRWKGVSPRAYRNSVATT